MPEWYLAWHSWSTLQARPSATIDLGTCVGVIKKRGRISTDGIGFRELSSWSVSPTMAAAASLTDKKPLAIRVQDRLDVGHGRG